MRWLFSRRCSKASRSLWRYLKVLLVTGITGSNPRFSYCRIVSFETPSKSAILSRVNNFSAWSLSIFIAVFFVGVRFLRFWIQSLSTIGRFFVCRPLTALRLGFLPKPLLGLWLITAGDLLSSNSSNFFSALTRPLP